jgi:diguanylate cyclase (GGDEF)-like protein/PAS domain S-box-containing protein
VLILSLIAIVYIGSGKIVLVGLNQLEEQRASNNVHQVLNELDEDIRALSITTADYAQSDDAAQFMRDANRDYILRNYAEANLYNRALNTVIFLRSNGEVLYSINYNLDAKAFSAVPQQFLRQLEPGQPLFNELASTHGISGILMLAEGPILIAAYPVLNSSGVEQSGGYLILGRYLDDAHITQINHRVGVTATLQSVSAVTATLEPGIMQALLDDPKPVLQSTSNNATLGYVLIRDVLGAPAFVIRVETPYTASDTSATIFLYLIITLVVVGLIYEIAILCLLEKFIFSRLTHLNKSVQLITGSSRLNTRVMDGHADELGSLARTINDMLDALAYDAQAKDESAERFRLFVEQSPTGMYFVTDHQFVYVNQAAAQIFGFAPDDISWNISPLDLVHPDDRHMVEMQSLAYNNTADSVTYMMRGICNDECIVHCSVNERRVTWKGKPSTLGIVIDVSERVSTQETLRKRERILEAINVIAQYFLKGSKWEESIQEVLNILAEATQSRCACVFKNHTLSDKSRTTSLRYLSLDSDVSRPMKLDFIREIRYRVDGFEQWEELLAQNKLVKSSIEDFPAAQRDILKSHRINSILVAPIFANHEWWGFAGIGDAREVDKWSPAEEDALKLFTNLLGSAIERKLTEEERKSLYEAERQRRQLAEALNETGTVLNASLDFEGILDCLLEQVERIVPYDLGFIMLSQNGQARVTRVHQRASLPAQSIEEMESLTFNISQTANLRWMAENGQPLVIPDTSFYPEYMPAKGLEQIGSWVQAPVMAGNIAIGFLFLGKQEPNAYSSETAAYVAPFALQTAFALQNARLYADVSESLTRERRYNEIVRAISSSMDISVILRNVAYLAADLVKADAAGMALLNSDGDLALNTYSTQPALKFPETVLHQGVGIAWQVMKTNKPLLAPDYPKQPNAIPEWVARGLHALIAVPIVAGETLLGVLHFFNVTPGKLFNSFDVAVATAIGQQAGMAIQRARLLENAHRRAQEAETLRQASAAITTTLELHETFQRILEQLERVVPYDTASIQLLHPGYLEIVGGRGWADPSKVVGTRFAYPGHNPNSLVVITRQPKLLTKADILDIAANSMIQSWLGVPLIIHDEVIGMLTLDSYEADHFHDDHIRLASAFADHVAVAIENARLFEKVQQLAMIDELTGLYNRRQFFILAEQAVESTIDHNQPFSLVMIDIDRFKRVNDTYGHLAGDQVLREIASRCRNALRSEDVLARYGGEEFVALLSQVQPDEACKIAERLRASISDESVTYQDDVINVTVSMGIANSDRTNATLDTLLMHADEAQYIAKNSGGNRIIIWQPEMVG